jgi:hypothetical protein
MPDAGASRNWKTKFASFGEKFSAKVEEIFKDEPKDFALGWDPENGFDIKSIPPEWKKLFQAAGVKRSELEDPNTAKFIVQTVQEASATEGQGDQYPMAGEPSLHGSDEGKQKSIANTLAAAMESYHGQGSEGKYDEVQ